ncbi:carboxypeptidase-like regulatory domain-containing protein [Pedobacter panaciterrae]|uniref:carboxypeptidase-like regulatory domain-containing protein n=1 Tax=Pedobacter panaciterrae TaxID=363849 RepID=UPI00155DB40C|nr:carboxypeptidase-like regulatory domain-containing protein [Pedobacter panaciterrae]NQX55437.1 carboxypeptidase-like regulatory domain-containing protein [Pedobacter panaciterrae]
MKQIIRLIFIILLTADSLKAQESFTISGTVFNAKEEIIQGATVFIDGSEKGTATNAKGEFKFANIKPGTYQVIVSMIGYASTKQNVIIQNQSASLNIHIKEKTTVLREVVIGDDSQRKENIKIFLKNFLGESANAKKCKILNLEIIDFSTIKTILEATSDDFLIIENKSLGYRIKYLLRNFRYNKGTGVTSYDGESVFENLAGTEEEKSTWIENRKKAYQGSLMHYLRSLYKNNLRQEGFITLEVKNNNQPLQLAPNPVNMEQYINTVDSNFIQLKFKTRLYIVFNKENTLKADSQDQNGTITKMMGKDGSIMRLFLDNAIIDSKGSYVDYRSFFIQGFWGGKRIGDQLPFEYN